MTRALKRRVDELEGSGGYYTIGELLDSLEGVPLPAGKRLNPNFPAFLLKNAG